MFTEFSWNLVWCWIFHTSVTMWCAWLSLCVVCRVACQIPALPAVCYWRNLFLCVLFVVVYNRLDFIQGHAFDKIREHQQDFCSNVIKKKDTWQKLTNLLNVNGGQQFTSDEVNKKWRGLRERYLLSWLCNHYTSDLNKTRGQANHHTLGQKQQQQQTHFTAHICHSSLPPQLQSKSSLDLLLE